MVADDHDVMREGLSGLLNEQKNFWVVGQAANGREAISLAEKCRPDVILMDVAMPEMDGVAATADIHTRHPEFHIIGLSMHDDPLTRESMLDAGAVDFVCKSDSTQKIVDAVRKAIRS
jgi:DNA-binding NarL/FixJ family response regulator